MLNSVERFSSRVENYIRYRPHYPQAVFDCLQSNCRLVETSVIADIGSGTGFLAELFLRNGNQVYAVEPNREMRAAGERFLRRYSNFQSVIGTAEETTLAEASVDFVTAGQAFHWFDRGRAKAEFKRILKSDGWAVLVWNERRGVSTPFGQDYEQLLRDYSTDYEKVDHKQINEKVLLEFFGEGFLFDTFENNQRFDFAGLKGRLLSSSYAPEAGHPQYEAMISELQRIFDAHQINGEVVFEYDTNIYYGHLNQSSES